MSGIPEGFGDPPNIAKVKKFANTEFTQRNCKYNIYNVRTLTTIDKYAILDLWMELTALDFQYLNERMMRPPNYMKELQVKFHAKFQVK